MTKKPIIINKDNIQEFLTKIFKIIINVKGHEAGRVRISVCFSKKVFAEAKPFLELEPVINQYMFRQRFGCYENKELNDDVFQLVYTDENNFFGVYFKVFYVDGCLRFKSIKEVT